MGSPEVDVVVIGAGPYGLATSAHLAETGLSQRVFGTPMAGWTEHMPRGMHLKSTAFDSDIGAPLQGFGLGDYCHSHGIADFDRFGDDWPTPIEHFVAYGRWFQQQLVPHVEDTTVQRVDRLSDGFELFLDDGCSVRAKCVVVAVGTRPFRQVPAELREDEQSSHRSSRSVTHASDHTDFSAFAGKTVAVIGAGQSALESSVLLTEAGARVQLIVRGPVIKWGRPPTGLPRTRARRLRAPSSRLSPGWAHLVVTRGAGAYRFLPLALRLRELRTILGPAGAWWLRERFNADIGVRLSTSVTSLKAGDDTVELHLRSDRGEENLVVDHVIAGTGYRFDLERLSMLSPDIVRSVAGAAGYPRLSGGMESSVPGLFFTGLAAAGSFGPMLRFVTGSDFAARRAARGVVRRRGGSNMAPAAPAMESARPEATG